MIKLTGVILAGGESSRIGINKACLKLGDKTFIEHVAGKLAPFCEEIIVVSNGKEEFSRLFTPSPLAGEGRGEGACRRRNNLRIIHTCSNSGPMAGLWTGLNAANTDFVFCTACDMPFIHPEIIAEVVNAITPDIQAVVPRYRGYLEPLCAVYSKACLDPIKDGLARADYKIQSVLENLIIKEIEEPLLLKHDPLGYTFFNINCPDDYEKAKGIY